MHTLIALAAVLATPRALPFSYTSETLPPGEVELEQFADVSPLRTPDPNSGQKRWFGASQMQTEIEYGIAPRLELGLYFTWVPNSGVAGLTEGNGLKQRLRYQFADPGEWPIDVGLYGEVVENEREIEVEAKILLQRRFGLLRLVANLWGEREFYYDGRAEWVLNPTLGATIAATAKLHLGVEAWLRTEFPKVTPKAFNQGPHAYVGPTIMFDWGKLWWSTGIYYRVTDTSREVEFGDAFGHVWARSIVGLSL